MKATNERIRRDDSSLCFRKSCYSADLNGADDPTRTDDLLITSELLYQLSYVGPGSEQGVSLLGRPSSVSG